MRLGKVGWVAVKYVGGFGVGCQLTVVAFQNILTLAGAWGKVKREKVLKLKAEAEWES
jgi:hypothetical protein